MTRKPPKQRQNEATKLAAILAEVVDRKRECSPAAQAEYKARHPELAEAIQSQLDMIALLEGARSAIGADPSTLLGSGSAPVASDLSRALSELPQAEQQLVFLRLVERRSWPEIAKALGSPIEPLRRQLARVVRQLIVRCEPWLTARQSQRDFDQPRR